jgi:hypothetical protein
MKLIGIALAAVMMALGIAPATASAQTGQLFVLDANGAKQHLCEVIDGSSNLYACNTLWGLTGSLPNYVTVETNHSLDETVVNFPSGFYAYQPDSLASGSIAAATLNASYTVNLANAEGVVGLNLSGLTASGATLTAEAADNSANWYPINLFSSVAGTPSTTATVDGNYKVNASGHSSIRLRVSTVGTGSIAVATVASSVSSMTTESNSSAIAAGVGSPGATPCAGDSGTCGLIALIERTNARITTLITNLGGGSPNASGNPLYFSCTNCSASTLGTTTTANIVGGSANTPLTQGTGVAGANSQNVFIGGAYSGITFNANLQIGGTALTSVTTTTTTAPANNIPVTDVGNAPWVDSTTALGASAAFTGTARTTPYWAKYFNATFYADQASATAGAEIDCSPDGGTTWRAMATATLVASANTPLSIFVSCPTYRVKLTNSTTAEGVQLITSSFTGG